MATETKKKTVLKNQAEAEKQTDMKQETAPWPERRQELINELVEKSKAMKNKLTYSAVADVLESTDLDKNQMDDIYEALMSRGIEIISETETDFDEELLLAEDPDLTEDPDLVMDESDMDLESSIPKGIAVDDPVRPEGNR